MNRKILVTGAAGFIGFYASLALKANGVTVIGLDNFNSYYDPLLKKARASLLREKGIEVLQGDICDEALLDKLQCEFSFTSVLHLAAQAGVRYSLENPRSYVASNLVGFVEILELCRKYTLPLVFASSSSVYGLNTSIPFKTTDKTDAPASLYGATKKSNELLAHSYYHLFKFPITGLRFFTVYGPFGRPDMAYYSFSEKILKGESLPVFNQGEMRRDFTYIDDIVEGIISAIHHNQGFNIFNLGNHQPENLMDMIRYLELYLGKKAHLNFLPMQKGDVKETFADIEKEKQVLNFCPKISLEEGLKRFTSWFLEEKKVLI